MRIRLTKARLAAPLAALIGLPALAVLVFLNSIPNGFVFDDVHLIQGNPWIRDFGHLREILTTHLWAFAGRDSSYYRPLVHVTYALIYVVVGPHAWAFRALSLLAHAAATVLVFLIAVRLRPQEETGHWTVTATLVASLLFAVHPVHVEAVAWISGFADLACATMFLAALLAFLAASDRPERSTALHAAGALTFLAATLFKEPGLTLPAVVLLADVVRPCAARRPAFWITRYGGLTLAAVVYFGLRHGAIGLALDESSSALGVFQAIDVAGTALWRYIAMLVWPFSLNVFRTMEDAIGLPSWGAWLGLVLAVAMAWRLRGATRYVMGMALLVLPMLPALFAPALLPGLDNPWAERYVYLPSAGFAILIGGAVALASRRLPALRLPLQGALTLVIVVFAVATVARNRVWRNDLTLLTDAVAKSPRSGIARSYLGWALFSAGDVDRAIVEYRSAIALNPGFSDAHQNLAVALATQGRHDAAVPAYLEAIRLSPGDALSHANLSLSLSRLGRYGEASKAASRAIEINPRLALAYTALGVAAGESGRIRDAMSAFEKALELDPSDERNQANLAAARRLLSASP